MSVLITGSQGFIGSYLCRQLLDEGYHVVGIDNFSKYGEVSRSHDKHQNFQLHRIDLSKDSSAIELESISQCEYIIAGAAMIGGISYFHKYAADLLRVNNAILNNTFEFAKKQKPQRIVVISSSMVFERATKYPTPEDEILTCPTPFSTYGFQKLCCEYYCKGYWEQYKIPYTIVRPFNCVGVGEEEAIGAEEQIGTVKMMLSHVLPDIVQRAILTGPDIPLSILGNGGQVRSYTNGKDIANGIIMAMQSDKAINEDFNISSPVMHTVTQLCEIVYKKLYNKPVPGYNQIPPYKNDVQFRWPDTAKAKNVLGFETKITLEESVDEVIDYINQLT